MVEKEQTLGVVDMAYSMLKSGYTIFAPNEVANVLNKNFIATSSFDVSRDNKESKNIKFVITAS